MVMDGVDVDDSLENRNLLLFATNRDLKQHALTKVKLEKINSKSSGGRSDHCEATSEKPCLLKLKG